MAGELWTPSSFNILRLRPRVRTLTLPNGERAKEMRDDSGTVSHIERDEGMDAIVRPKTIRLKRSIKDPFVRQLIAAAERKDRHGPR